MERLEQEKRLEMGVGGQASIHPPVPVKGVWGTRATGGGRKGSQSDGDGLHEGRVGMAGQQRGGAVSGSVRGRDGGGGGWMEICDLEGRRALGCVSVVSAGMGCHGSLGSRRAANQRGGHGSESAAAETTS